VSGHDLLRRISIDPRVCFGKPCIRRTRIWVSLILDNLAEGVSAQELLGAYPQLTADDIRAAIAYGAEMAASASSTFRQNGRREAEAGREPGLDDRGTSSQCSHDVATVRMRNPAARTTTRSSRAAGRRAAAS
jgi:uncharacterized protein (DUF433 family)